MPADIGSRERPCAARRLRDLSAPVIALADGAAWAGFHFFDAANDLGAVAVLQRPFSRAALLRLMARVLDRPAHEQVAAEEGDDAEQIGLAELIARLENRYFA